MEIEQLDGSAPRPESIEHRASAIQAFAFLGMSFRRPLSHMTMTSVFHAAAASCSGKLLSDSVQMAATHGRWHCAATDTTAKVPHWFVSQHFHWRTAKAATAVQLHNTSAART